MNSLSELRDFLIKQDILIKEFSGWQLKVGKDIWTMSDGVFYKNTQPQNLKQKDLFNNYKGKQKNDSSSTQTRKWRGIGSGRLLRDGEHG